MRQIATLLFIAISVTWPSTADAFTSGLFRLMKVNDNNQSSETAGPTTEVSLNLIVEADTYTPYFYRGRAEPTAGSAIRLIVVPNDSSLITKYKWTINGVLASGSGETIQAKVPTGVSEVTIEVSALDQNNNVIGKTTSYVPLSNSSLSFYEVNPLRGVSSVAIGRSLNLIGDEISVRAEPYFLNTLSLTSIRGSWNTGSLNNVPADDWRNITILRTDDITRATINLQARNTNSLSETVGGSFILEI